MAQRATGKRARIAGRRETGRRGLWRGLGAAALVSASLAVAACAPAGAGDEESRGSITWGSWPYYIDYDAETDTIPSLEMFTEETGIEVEYLEDIDGNLSFYARIKDALALDQHIGYDVFVPNDWLINRMVSEGSVQRLDRSAMPNVEANMLDLLRDSKFDPGREYSAPYLGFMTGLAWNTEKVPGGVSTLDDLLDPKLKGKVGVLSEMRETMGIIMLGHGVDISGDWGDAEFYESLDWLQRALDSGQITQVKGNSYTQDLENETTWVQLCWSGDIALLNDEYGEDKWAFAIPETGATMSFGSFVVPNGTEKVALVQELIDFYYRPDIAARVATSSYMISPVRDVREEAAKIAPEVAENTMIFPTDEMLANLREMRQLTPEEDNRYSQAFAQALGL